MRKNLARLIALGCLAASATAGAQWDPESGDTGQWQPPPEEQPPPQQQQQPPPQQQQQQQPTETPWGGQQQPPPQQQQSSWGQQPEETPPPATEEPAGDTDHSKVSFGVSFIGFERFALEPVDMLMNPDDGPFQLGITTVGVRLWVSEMLGLDIGLGLGIKTDSYSNDNPAGPSVQTGRDGAFAFRLHVGLPVALKTYEHFNILLIPEVGFTYASTTFIVDPTDVTAASDVDVSAIALDVGIKVGGELHFGFWGVPNLSLQATIGLGLRYASRTAENSLDFAAGGFGVTSSGISLQTLGQQLGSSVRINYYF